VTPEEHAKQELSDPDRQKNIDALAIAVGKATDVAVLKELRDIAIAKLKGEDERQASITARAQGLFASLSLFGFVLTFAATLLTTTTVIGKPLMIVCGSITLYVVVQVIVVIANISNAIGGIGALAAGSSDLTRWAKSDNTADFYRAQTLAYLDYYRWHSLTNTWRFVPLENAIRGVRNTVVALSIFALTLLMFAILKPETPKPPTSCFCEYEIVHRI